MNHEAIIKPVQHWVETLVVAFNLCPFARRELINNRIRFSVTSATSEHQLLQALQSELEILNDNTSVETTLLIHPNVLQNFYDYNEFLEVANGLLTELELDGVVQIASFHPKYQFANTEPEDVENYTNRSPFPLLHLIREDSLDNAISHYPETNKIPERNIALLKSLGETKMRALFQSHFKSV